MRTADRALAVGWLVALTLAALAFTWWLHKPANSRIRMYQWAQVERMYT